MSGEIKEIVDKLSNRKQETLIQGLRECQLKDIEHPFITKEEYIDKLLNYITSLQQKVEQLENIRKEAIEYLTSYESISTIQGLNDIEKNKILDEKTMNEMVNRYLKVHDILLNILNKGE